jgi:L-amino acid N-acyltransferase
MFTTASKNLSLKPVHMITRDAEIKDLPVILDIMNDAILHTTSIYDYGIRDTEYVAAWFEKKKTDKMPVLVCEINERAVAYGSYGIFRAWDAYRFSVEHSIYVHKDFRGRGIGKQLLKDLIQRAKTEGYHTMIAGIDSSNQHSCDFHKKQGFVEVGKFMEVGYKFDRWLHLVFLQLML